MTIPPSFSKQKLDLEGNSYTIQILKFENGIFLSISQDSETLGSMMVSIGSGPNPVTTTVIPAKTNLLFLKLLAERISSMLKGISIVSSSIKKELDNNTAKNLMVKIMEMVQNV